MIKTYVLIAIIILGFPAVSLAYIDPGSSNVILQLIIASLVGMSLFFKNIIYFFKTKKEQFLKSKNEIPKEESKNNEQPQRS